MTLICKYFLLKLFTLPPLRFSSFNKLCSNKTWIKADKRDLQFFESSLIKVRKNIALFSLELKVYSGLIVAAVEGSNEAWRGSVSVRHGRRDNQPVARLAQRWGWGESPTRIKIHATYLRHMWPALTTISFYYRRPTKTLQPLINLLIWIEKPSNEIFNL